MWFTVSKPIMNQENLRDLIISPMTSLKEAMKSIGQNYRRIFFVVDDGGKLMGSLTDGDIRRAILNGTHFQCPIREIMFKTPRSVTCSEKNYREIAKEFIQREKLYAIPCLDKTGTIVDVLSWYDFFEKHPSENAPSSVYSNPVVIMAGGQGTRLDPFTKILPKPLIPMGDKTIIEKIMEYFMKSGFHQFVFTLNYKKEFIKIYFKDHELSQHVQWVEEDQFLGTAGGLALLKNKLQETFFISNCDTLLEKANFSHMLSWHKSEKALLTLVGCHKEMVIPYGTIIMNNGVVQKINEKPKYDFVINTGVYIMEPEVLEFIQDGEFLNMNQLVERTILKGKVTVFPLYEGWFDLGQWHEYNESLHLLDRGSEGSLKKIPRTSCSE